MSDNRNPRKPRKHNWLITHPRTASNLLARILNLEEQGARPGPQSVCFFIQSLPKRSELVQKPASSWTQDDRLAIEEIEQKCVQALQEFIDAATREDQVVFLKEHALLFNHPLLENEDVNGKSDGVGEPSRLPAVDGISSTRSALNKTIFSDEWLMTWNPTFLIRHPALAITSLYRAMRHDIWGRKKLEPTVIERNYFWQRTLLEFYVNAYDETDLFPIVIDADDMISSPGLMSHYARITGLNPDKLRFTWDRASAEELDKMSQQKRMMLSSLNESDQLDSSKVAGSLDMDQEKLKWVAEFGEEDAKTLEEWVRAAMPHYEYMRLRRLTLGTA
ncbi:hypothetical protein LIA77_06781 [Sarocladium implicatum]|nr:hypothetical protein LIA77_06781 [Sarocladium implicatum]